MALVPDGEHTDLVTTDLAIKFVEAMPGWVSYAVDIAVKRHGLPVEYSYQTETTLGISDQLYMVLNHNLGSVSVLKGPRIWNLSTRVFFEELKQPLDRTSPGAWYDLMEKAIHTTLHQHIQQGFEDIDWVDPESVFDP